MSKDTYDNKENGNVKKLTTNLSKAGWRKDKVTDFIYKSQYNISVSFLKFKSYFRLLIEVGLLLQKAVDAVEESETEEEIILASFLGRTYGCYLSAVRLSTSGQLTEAYILFRGCLENALYAFYIKRKPELTTVWLNRHISEESKQEVKRRFQIGEMMKLLEKEEPEIGQYAKELYDGFIDYGAHPNERSISTNLEFFSDGRIKLHLLNTSESFMQGCFVINARAGLCSLSIFRLVYLDQFNKAYIPKKLFQLYKRQEELGEAVAAKLKTEAAEYKEETNKNFVAGES